MDIKAIAQKEKEGFQNIYWEGNFQDYLAIAKEIPEVYCNAFQRLYNMIMFYGKEEYDEFREKRVRYTFFNDPFSSNSVDAVYGIDKYLMEFVKLIEAGANGYGVESRILLLHGPVGSSKSTIARLLKKGLEEYTKTNAGALYTYKWLIDKEEVPCPMHEEPLHLIPLRYRKEFGFPSIKGEMCPVCNYYFNDLWKKYNGDFEKILEHVKIFRFVFSEYSRIGIATFQPRDEKSQDSTELTGDINYRKIAEIGSDSSPLAFNFDGEFNASNRGMLEGVELLKATVTLLYDFLTASQEHKIKPKKFPHTDIDEVIVAHTNNPEYNKLQRDNSMEALRDRIVKVNVPYVLKLDDEIKIYQKSFNKEKVKKHIAPHTVEIAAMWAVLTRLDPPEGNVTVMQKMKLYNGKHIPGFTAETVRELRERGHVHEEGMSGISPRYIQDKISNAIVKHTDSSNVNPFMVLNELDEGLDHYSLISSKDQIKKYRELLQDVKEEYEDMIKNEVQKAISADEDALLKLCGNYIDNVKAYTQKEKIKNKFTGADEEPNERLMRSIEEKINIPDDRKEDFRQQIMSYIAAISLEGKKFDYKSNERLLKALELKLFEDQKDSIKLTSLVSGVIDSETQKKIDIVKQRLIDQYGYDESSAVDVLQFVSSIFSRAESKK